MFKFTFVSLILTFCFSCFALENTDYKRLFSEILTKHIIQDSHRFDEKTDDPFFKIKDSIYFNPKPFEELYLDILKEKKSISAFKKREELLSNNKTLTDLMNSGITPPNALKWEKTNAFSFVNELQNQFKDKGHREGNYFKTKVGKKVLEHLKDTIFILLPGFGNHTVAHMGLPDLIKDINLYYGRSRFRPYRLLQIIPTFTNYKKYYGNNNQKVGFDILQPMGMELGLSTGRHEHNSAKLREWINGLPGGYADKKIVFLGYSKGTTIALDVVKDFEDIRKRVKGIIGLAGPFQGSISAEMTMRRLFRITPAGTKEAFIEWSKSISSSEMVYTLLNKYADSFSEKHPIVSYFLSSITNLNEEHFETVKAHIEYLISQDMREVINGFYEESQYHMLDWSIKHLNNETFDQPISIFSLSFLSNINDFFIKGPISENGEKSPPEMIPQLTVNGGIDFESFSPDILVLKLTSMDTMEYTPGGTSDTQVAWADSKPITFDPTPLSLSFTNKELMNMYKDEDNQEFFKKNNLSFTQFKNSPRNKIFKSKNLDNVEFVDLGEVRGTHWSNVFRQVLKLPGFPIEWGHNHVFPNRALAKTLMETYTIKVLLEGGQK